MQHQTYILVEDARLTPFNCQHAPHLPNSSLPPSVSLSLLLSALPLSACFIITIAFILRQAPLRPSPGGAANNHRAAHHELPHRGRVLLRRPLRHAIRDLHPRHHRHLGPGVPRTPLQGPCALVYGPRQADRRLLHTVRTLPNQRQQCYCLPSEEERKTPQLTKTTRFCFGEFSSNAISIAVSRLLRAPRQPGNKNPYHDALPALLQSYIQLDVACRLADCIAIILTFLTLVSLGIGVNIVRTGEPARHDRLIRRVAYGLAGTLGLVAAAVWAARFKVYIDVLVGEYQYYLDGQDERDTAWLNAAQQLDFAFVVIVWALSIAVMARSTQKWLPSLHDKHADVVSDTSRNVNEAQHRPPC